MSYNSDKKMLKRDLTALIDAARPFLSGELEQIDPELPSLVGRLRSLGAGECWHKTCTFLEHFTGIYRILKLWSMSDAVARCGLYHSAYSNSPNSLAIFAPGTKRKHVQDIIGAPAESLVHLLCIVLRQPVIENCLLFHYSDEELVEHLVQSEESVTKALKNGVSDCSELWRTKLQSLLPAEGIKAKHIRTGEEDVWLSRKQVAMVLLMTMADFSEQLFDFQDKLFENNDAKLSFRANNWTALWPGEGKPGLWMSYISKMGAMYSLIVREEHIYMLERKQKSDFTEEKYKEDSIELVIPQVFDNCTKVLEAKEEIIARDLYWEAVISNGNSGDHDHWKMLEGLLVQSCEKNPYVGEPHLVLGQVYLNQGRYEEAENEAEKGLKLMLEWGSSWDKRMTWESWVAWGRVLLSKAKEKSWPHTSWGVINLGLVR